MDPVHTEDGHIVFVSPTDEEIGSKGAFYVVYASETRDDRYGYFCSNCELVDNAMDPMGRLVCNECGNTRRPDEWDAAHE